MASIVVIIGLTFSTQSLIAATESSANATNPYSVIRSSLNSNNSKNIDNTGSSSLPNSNISESMPSTASASVSIQSRRIVVAHVNNRNGTNVKPLQFT